MQADRRSRQQQHEQRERDQRDDDGHDRHLANLDAADRDRPVQRRDRGGDLAERVVAEVDDQRHGLEQERDRERGHEHHRRRLAPERPEDDAVHRERERDDDREARGDAPRDGPSRGEGERVRARHHELAVGEVDEPQDAEDEADPDGHQRVDRAEPERIGERREVEGGKDGHAER